MVWTCVHLCVRVCVYMGGRLRLWHLGRVYVCGELVKAGNASRCYIEPLDWSIIILGTHPFLFSLSVSLLRLLRLLALPRFVVLSVFELLQP